jgi:glyoxylase-like metal-dependent hydrolase (beta-lactamase superfamily II)
MTKEGNLEMQSARQLQGDVHILPSFFPIPGLGVLSVNAFVLRSREPVLIDTGLHQDSDRFVEQLESVIDPEDLRWLFLTHPDQDHVGSLMRLVNRLPRLRLITTFLGHGILGLFAPIPPDRVYYLNPGESIDVGDRRLACVQPPTFDNPSTTALYDRKSGVLFSSDCFGAVLDRPADDAREVDEESLARGQIIWATVDSPWLHRTDETKFLAELQTIRSMAPSLVLSAHLPPAVGSMTDGMLKNLAEAVRAPRFVGPNQAALEVMIAQMTQTPMASQV